MSEPEPIRQDISSERAARVDEMCRRWLDCEQDKDPVARRLSRLALETIATGSPMPLSEARTALALSEEKFANLVRRMSDGGHLTLYEADGTITGAFGLSVVPSRHVLVLNGRRLYTWCAFDAVGIPAALMADAQVESQCADTGEPVWLELVRGGLSQMSPADLRIAMVPPRQDTSMCDEVCPAITFHSNATTSDDPRVVLMTVEEALRLGRDHWAGCRVG